MNKKLSPIFSNDYDDLKRYNTTFNVRGQSFSEMYNYKI